MQELLKDEIKNFGADFGKLEQAVMAMMMSFGKGLLQRMVDCGTNGYKGSSIACECDSSMKFVQHRPRDIHILFRWIKLKRAYYHCQQCGAGLCPYDVTSGLDIGSGAVEGACKHVVGKRLKQSGMFWSKAGSSATLALQVTWVNKRWDKLWSQQPLAA